MPKKRNVTISLNEENIEKLKQIKNASALIDGLLSKYFNDNDVLKVYENMSIDELKRLQKVEEKKEELKKELEKLENDNKF